MSSRYPISLPPPLSSHSPPPHSRTKLNIVFLFFSVRAIYHTFCGLVIRFPSLRPSHHLDRKEGQELAGFCTQVLSDRRECFESISKVLELPVRGERRGIEGPGLGQKVVPVQEGRREGGRGGGGGDA
jgi:hypothetical protein